jgi:predicted 2-oxoglutarate/Fe(II)-dependent dioxygenase YbiX
MKVSDQALILKNFISADICQQYIQYFEKNKIKISYESSLNASSGIIQESSGKTLEIKKADKYYQEINQKIELALQYWVEYLKNKKTYNTYLFSNLLLFPHKIRMIKYEKGLSIQPHTDWDHFTHASVTINLNSGYEGGDFLFFHGKEKINLSQGDVLVFPADPFWVHEVTPVTKFARYSINTFIRSIPEEYFQDHVKAIQKYQLSKDRYHIE